MESRGALALYASLFAVTVCLYVKLARTSPGYGPGAGMLT